MKALAITALLLISFNAFSAEIKLHDPKLNEPAPNFVEQNSYGVYVQLSDFIGQPVILEWTNHECPYVARHYSKKNMQAVQKAAQKKGFIWLSIISSTPGDQGHVSGDQANELTMSRNASPTHVLLDESGKIGMQYGAKTTPHMFMIDATGVLRYKGAIDDIGQGMKFFDASFNDSVNYISTQLDAVLKNSELEISNTVAYGCSVKYDY
jgi:peroxiredoxin